MQFVDSESPKENTIIQFDPVSCQNLDFALSREWLETNGLGGFASSTILGLNTRRYHGLLIGAIKPPVHRLVLLSKLEETLIIDGNRYEFSTNQYPNVIYPQGYKYLTEFKLHPFPTFIFQIEGVHIEKTIFMVHGQNSTVVQYKVETKDHDKHLNLEIRPLIAFRDYHTTTRENRSIFTEIVKEENLVSISPYFGLPRLYFAHNATGVSQSKDWYRNFEYRKERERGLDFVEDLYNPFMMTFDLNKHLYANIIASVQKCDILSVMHYRQAEIDRRKITADTVPATNPLAQHLALAADQFIVNRADQKTILAGYHWFTDWGRDAMISLPGAALVRGKIDIAKSILLFFAHHCSEGMMPNRFPDGGGEPEYMGADVSLWFIDAVNSLLKYTNDYNFVREYLYPVMTDVIDWYSRGTRYGIRADEDGLLSAGEKGIACTWMDAKIGDWVVTPRTGKAVEIQALWYNALKILEDLSEIYGDHDRQKRFKFMADWAITNFNKSFWNEGEGCLFDVVYGEKKDASIRPNQVFAVSLPYSMLDASRSRQVVNVVEQHLLTPMGLRTLAAHEKKYCGKCEGGWLQRDGSYHQGTVWPWLMGPFIKAYIRVNNRSHESRKTANDWLNNFYAHLSESGLGHISEIFDGDRPHLPRGCIAQAWNAAQLLQVMVEDVDGVHDPQQMKINLSA